MIKSIKGNEKKNRVGYRLYQATGPYRFNEGRNFAKVMGGNFCVEYGRRDERLVFIEL